VDFLDLLWPNRHPMWRLAATAGRLPRYAALAREVCADPGVPAARKAVL